MDLKIIKNHIKTPRITEKGSILMEGNVYAFDVNAGSSKNEIKKAIFEIYKVKPVRVHVLKVPAKRVTVRGKSMVKHGGRKAYVYLKTGDKIEFI